ncbi:phage major capsid protein [Amycolatopsis sp., V23-08]|uniref:Phage major capsid protein n=1 Tax=Amycolatopsis heterodermiae TaxID=3110235 RepID=A0ABU5RIU3_9PSEU|nr:phage major capsid protein [Amycolatopsis sp., V23-08]MEA5366093.1 phage major capsid protein [Amycolatopsis sp., V23-08]
MTTATLSPGMRDRLDRLGIPHTHIGRVVNDLTTIPRNSTELEEFFGDVSQVKKVASNSADLVEFINKYAEQQSRIDDSIEAQVKELAEAQFADILRKSDIDNINRLNLDPSAIPVQRNKFYNSKAPGAGLDKKFGNWADYMAATWIGHTDGDSLAARSEVKKIQNAFGSSIPGDGGFLIPEVLRAELLRVALEQAVVRNRARVVPMDSLSVPYPTIDSTSNASSVYGGITGYWTEEGGTLTDSSPKFGRIELVAKKLTLYSEIPNELFQDSIITLQQFLSESFPEALAWFEDVGFTSGNGVGMPLGYLNASAAVTVAAEAGQPTGTIVWENLVRMYSRMLPSSMNRAVWVANIDTFPQLATMALSVGTGGSAIWIGESQGGNTPPVQILGRPVIFTEKVSTVGTSGDINLVDFGYYLIGDRQVMQSNTSTDYKFGQDKTALRVIERVDGTPWIKSAITPKSGSSNTLSPFVKLADRP